MASSDCVALKNSKIEQVESASAPTSWVLDVLRRSSGMAFLRKRAIRPLREQMIHYFAGRNEHTAPRSARESEATLWIGRVLGTIAVAAIGYSMARVVMIFVGLHRYEFQELGIGLGATFLRVNAALILGSLWTIPVGVAIGFNPRMARIAQPLAQIAASVPATALFPVVLLILIRLGGGLGFGSIVLLLLGTQWYILFNVIAGAMAIPSDLKEAAGIFGLRGWDRWRKLVLPGIFPFLVTVSGHGLRRRLECKYCRGILPLQRSDVFHDRGRGHDFSRHRRQEFSSSVGWDDCAGCSRGYHESSGVAALVPACGNAIQA